MSYEKHAFIDVDLTQLTKALTRTQRAAVDLRPVWKELTRPLKADMFRHIREQRAASGAAWPALAPSTIIKRLKSFRTQTRRAGTRVMGAGFRWRKTTAAHTKKGRLRKSKRAQLNRILSGKLISRPRIQSAPQFLSYTARGAVAAVHQLGGLAGRGSRIPAREYIYVGEPMQQLTRIIVERYLRMSFEGRKI